VPSLLVVGGGLFGSAAAAYARSKGYEALVFDPGLAGAASPAAAGLFKEEWAGRKGLEHYHSAVPVLDELYGIRNVQLTRDDGSKETLLWVRPALILDQKPIRQAVTSVGDGWLEAGGRRYEGWIYIAAGVWSPGFLPGLNVTGRAGSSFVFQGEREGRTRPVARGRQAIAFVRDLGTTFFSDGTAERYFSPQHDEQTLARAAGLGLPARPTLRYCGFRPYTPGGPFFQKIASRTWLATGGRKMGTILGASFARRLVEKELRYLL
jgi:glycine/D-amino acid oxidase-like deaminating enzyme